MCSIFPLVHLNERIKGEKREKHTCTWYMAKTYPNICECEIHSIREEKMLHIYYSVHFVSIQTQNFRFFSFFVSWNYIPWYILMPSHTVECRILFGIIKKTNTMEPNEIRVDENEWTDNGKSISRSSSTHIFVRFFSRSFSRILCFETSFFGRVSRTNNIWQA